MAPGRAGEFGRASAQAGVDLLQQRRVIATQVFSYPMFRDLERVQQVFTGIAAHVNFGANLAYKGQTQNGEGMLVSGSYFGVLGVRPALGRLLTSEDDKNVGSHFVTVLSHRYWTSKFDQPIPSVLNETIIVNGQGLTIVGVAAAGFDGTTLGTRPQVFVPITMRGLMQPGFTAFENRRSYWAYLFARRKPGVSLEQAKAAHQRAVSRDRQRRRSAAADRHERPDDGALQGEATHDGRGLSRPEFGA